jgi:hypothetical protein
VLDRHHRLEDNVDGHRRHSEGATTASPAYTSPSSSLELARRWSAIASHARLLAAFTFLLRTAVTAHRQPL